MSGSTRVSTKCASLAWWLSVSEAPSELILEAVHRNVLVDGGGADVMLLLRRAAFVGLDNEFK